MIANAFGVIDGDFIFGYVYDPIKDEFLAAYIAYTEDELKENICDISKVKERMLNPDKIDGYEIKYEGLFNTLDDVKVIRRNQ